MTKSTAATARPARYTYRLRASRTALAALEREWSRCRWVWNECVALSGRVHEHNGATGGSTTCGFVGLSAALTRARAATPWLREGACVPQQQTVRDFANARAKALKDIRDGLPHHLRAGMPKPRKKRRTEPTFEYTRRGFRLRDGRLHLAGGIAVTVVRSRPLPSEPSSVRVYRDGLGHWYASFVVLVETEPLPSTGAVIGVDWGVRQIATTTSDAHDLPHPEHGKAAARRLAHYQRMMSRRATPRGRPSTAGYRKARARAAKAHRKIARQRLDTARKWAASVVRDFDALAIEDFRPGFLAKTPMARKAADGVIGTTKRILIEQAHKHGRTVHLVHPAHTTRDCAHCGARAKHAVPLSNRTHACAACGFTSPRDKNSARVMLVRAGLVPVGVDLGPGSSESPAE
ncbi:RNA-guided endonuclease InsQ/TnpB family protein [Streptomyces sp. BI20]|uniref:RNA-guided endonuclease InsQ/TnpB family protein n=1 Tax=Streptomyces sp. BI20 TaxID=3403460 RepID=UPI003C783235